MHVLNKIICDVRLARLLCGCIHDDVIKTVSREKKNEPVPDVRIKQDNL